jgi:hypothetical protein
VNEKTNGALVKVGEIARFCATTKTSLKETPEAVVTFTANCCPVVTVASAVGEVIWMAGCCPRRILVENNAAIKINLGQQLIVRATEKNPEIIIYDSPLRCN